jgi:2-polyprenyl-3-methyl-5-hydroxy-6-metoxy-1,4-benzoquinol methylase
MLTLARPFAASVLDIGAATGAFVNEAKASGWTAIGLEPNRAMQRKAMAGHRDVWLGGWEKMEGRHDVITLMDVFEHLTRPAACLERMLGHLTSEGVVYIEMPEADCPGHAKEGLEWKHVRPTQHLALYSDPAARRLFEREGYRIEMVFRPRRGTLGKIAYIIAPQVCFERNR